MLADQFKRKIDYLRVSVTDRCDLRCTYCMAEDVTFLPRQEVLSIEEIIKLIDVFNELGVKKAYQQLKSKYKISRNDFYKLSIDLKDD